MKSSKFKALRKSVAGVPCPGMTSAFMTKIGRAKHPIYSGAVPLVQYVAPAWRYGNHSNLNPR